MGQRGHALTAYCTVTVTGKGVKQVETDYLPHVVACENGGADTEALKAQAVAARSFMYYKVKSSGAIGDGTSDQVYTCGNQPSSKHYSAVQATAGQVLVYSGVVICAFYVAGAKPQASNCVAQAGDSDPTSTEKWVTYNEGKTGNGITQTKLGWVSTTNLYNRGCKSQNGSHCQSLKGKKYPDILKFYYGADIQFVTAQGSCVNPPTPDSKPWPTPDAKPWPTPDTKPWPKADSKPWPTPDTKPWPKADTQPWPSVDGKPLPTGDQGPLTEAGPPLFPGTPSLILDGGCSVGTSSGESGGQLGFPSLILLLAVLLRAAASRTE